MNPRPAYYNGRFVDDDSIRISPLDTGFLLGATVTERMRTFGGKLFALERHFERLACSTRLIGLDHLVDLGQLRSATVELAAQHQALGEPSGDVGVCVFITPGTNPGQPTVCAQAYPLRFSDFADLYQRGQPLRMSEVRQVPSNCWPSELKCRSRMHYFLADRAAKDQDPEARALVCDQEGFVAEATTANVLMYCAKEGFVSPQLDRILPGVSLSFVETLAGEIGLKFSYRDIQVDELYSCDEVLLCSTSPCVLPVLTIDERHIGAGVPGQVFHQVMDAWSRHVGFDIIEQSRQNASRQ